MKTFLLWRSSASAGSEGEAARVGATLQRRLAPLFRDPPALQTRSLGSVHLAWLELPTQGFRASFFEEDALTGCWALAPDYPLNARRLLGCHGAQRADGH